MVTTTESVLINQRITAEFEQKGWVCVTEQCADVGNINFANIIERNLRVVDLDESTIDVPDDARRTFLIYDPGRVQYSVFIKDTTDADCEWKLGIEKQGWVFVGTSQFGVYRAVRPILQSRAGMKREI